MSNRQTRLVTAEAVRRGHPDKLCDISLTRFWMRI